MASPRRGVDEAALRDRALRFDRTPDHATGDSDAIRARWNRWPDANVGIATGASSDLVVIDVDAEAGGDEALAALERDLGKLPATVEVISGGGGRHLYFRHPGGQVPNSVGTLGPGLDVRGDNGFVAAPPSRHVTGRAYEWEASSEIDDAPMAELPTA